MKSLSKLYLSLISLLVIAIDINGQLPIVKLRHTRFDERHNLASKTITDLYIDSLKQIWVLSNGKLQYFDGEIFSTPLPTAHLCNFILPYKGQNSFSVNDTLYDVVDIDRRSVINHRNGSPLPQRFFLTNEYKDHINYNNISIKQNSIVNHISNDTLLKNYSATRDNYFLRITQQKFIQLIEINTGKKINIELQRKMHKYSHHRFLGHLLFYITDDDFLTILDIYTKKILTTKLKFPLSNQLNWIAVAKTADQSYVVAINKQLFILDYHGEVQCELKTMDNAHFVTNSFVTQLVVDEYGNIYVLTTNEGLIKINKSNSIRYYSDPTTDNKFCKSIRVDKSHNNVIIGTWDNGLMVFDTAGILKHHITDFSSSVHFPTIAHILSLHDNQFLLFLFKEKNTFLLRFDKYNKPFVTPYRLNTDGSQFYADDCMIGHCRKIVVGGNNIYTVTDSSSVSVTSTQLHTTVNACCSIGDSLIVAGHFGRIFLYTSSPFTLLKEWTLPVGIIRCVRKKNDHQIYFGADKGLYVFDFMTNNYQLVALANNTVYAIQYDHDNTLWVSTDRGINAIKEDEVVKNIDVYDGLQDWEFNTNACTIADNGELYFGGVYGTNSFYPYQSFDNDATAFINGISCSKNIFNYKIPHFTKIKLPYKCGLIKIKIGIDGSMLPSHQNKQYFIEGLNDVWMDLKNENELQMVLQSGTHKMYYHCSKRFDPKAPKSKYITIEVYTPFYLRWWFGLLSFIATVAGVTYLINIYKNIEFEKTKALWEAKETLSKERNRMSRELHDFIGAQLSIISRNIYWINEHRGHIDEKVLYEKLDHIAHLSSKTNVDIRDTIWASKKETLTLDDVFNRLKSLTGSLASDFAVLYGNGTPGIALSSFEAINILRICQESINNSIKHSKCKNISIASYPHGNNGIVIRIEDDGIGFDMDDLDGTTNGLANIKERAAEINYSCTIQSQLGKGCHIKLTKNE